MKIFETIFLALLKPKRILSSLHFHCTVENTQFVIGKSNNHGGLFYSPREQTIDFYGGADRSTSQKKCTPARTAASDFGIINECQLFQSFLVSGVLPLGETKPPEGDSSNLRRNTLLARPEVPARLLSDAMTYKKGGGGGGGDKAAWRCC